MKPRILPLGAFAFHTLLFCLCASPQSAEAAMVIAAKALSTIPGLEDSADLLLAA